MPSVIPHCFQTYFRTLEYDSQDPSLFYPPPSPTWAALQSVPS